MYTPPSGIAMSERLPILLLLLACAAPFTGCGGCGEKQSAVTGGSDVRFVVDEQLRGLRVRLADAVPPPTPVEPARLVEGEPLTQQQLERLLAQLPPLPRVPERVFTLPPGPAPPTTTGELAPFPSVPQGEASSAAEAPLTVVRSGPRGEVDDVVAVAVTFSRPMVDPDDPGNVPLRMKPSPPGQWRWVDARVAVFEPEGPLPQATEFRVEVPAGVESLDGSSLAAPHVFTLATPTPALDASHPFGGPHPLQPVIFLGFDQRVEASALLPHVTVTSSDGVEFPLRLASADEVRADAEVHRLAVRALDGCWAALRPRDPLPRGEAFHVVVRAGAPAADGPRPTQQDQSFSFSTFGPLRVEDARCGWGDGCAPNDPWIVRLTNPIDPSSFEPADIELEPAQTGLRLQVWEDSLSLEGVKRGRTRYKVVLPDTLRDVFGQTLGAVEPLSFEVAPARRSLVGPDTDMLVIAPAEPAVVPVQSVDHERLRVRIHRVDPSLWAPWMAWQEQSDGAAATAGQMPGDRLRDHVLVVEGAPGRQTETAIDLGPYLVDARGQFAVHVEPVGADGGEAIALWVEVTDLAVAAYAHDDDLVTWVTSLSSGSPLPDVEVTVPPGEAVTTDSSGLAIVPLLADGRPPIVVRSGRDVAILPWGEGGVGNSRPDRMVWYTTDVQGAYRPGEGVRVKGWLRRLGSSRDGDLGEMTPSPARVAWSLLGPSGRDRDQGVVRVGPQGGFDLTFSVPSDMAPGEARLRLYAVGVRTLDGTEHEHGFVVVSPSGREPELRVARGPHHLGEEVIIDLETSPALPGTEVRWAVESVPTTFVPARREAFQFGPGPVAEAGSHDHVELYDGRTDAAGRHHLGVHFESMQPPLPMQVRVEAMVGPCDPAMTSFVVHPSELYVGLKPVRSFVQAGEPVEVKVMAVDIGGEAVPRTAVTVRLSRVGPAALADETVVCDVTTGDDVSVCTFTPETGGSYSVVASARDSEGRPCETELRIHVAGGETAASDPARALELIGPGGTVRPGETAEILLRAPFYPADGVLTVRRSGLLDALPLHLDGPATTLNVPVGEQHVPNMDLQVDLVGRGGERARGRLSLLVDARARALDVVLLPRDSAVSPGNETVLNLSVTDSDGRPALGAELFVVAVPADSDHRLAHPLDVFYSPREDEVVETRLRDLLQAPERIEPDRGVSPASGGLDVVGEPSAHLPGFVVAASLFADASGTASVRLKLPEDPGGYRVMAVAASGGRRFGYGETEVTVRAPLTVETSTPRFLRLGDRVELPVVLHNRGSESLTVELAARVHGAALGVTADLAAEDLPDTSGVRVTLHGRERVEVRFSIVPTSPGTARLQLIAAGGSFLERVFLDVPVQVEDELVAVTGEVGDEPLGLDLRLPSEIWPQVGGLEIVTSSSARLLLSDTLAGLLDADRCGSEPLASAILALAPQRDALSALAGPSSAEQLEQRVARDIAGLAELQNPDGGFPLWRAGGPSHPFASAHAAHAFSQAHDHEYDVPWQAWTSALRYLGRLEETVSEGDDPEAGVSLFAYALFARYRMGDVDLRAARQALDEPIVEVLPAEACGWLAPVLFAGGDRTAAAQLAQSLEARAAVEGTDRRFTDSYSKPGVLLYSQGREDGIVLDALLKVAPEIPLVESLAQELLARQAGGQSPGAMTGCFSLLALDRYLDRTEPGVHGPMSRAWLGQAFVGERVLGGKDTHHIEVPMDFLVGADDAVPLVIQRRGSGPLFHRVVVRLAPGRPPAAGQGVAVVRTLEAVDDPRDVRRGPDGTWTVRAGARVRVVLTVVSEQPRDHVSVISPLPAGVVPAYTEPTPTDWYDHEVVGDEQAAVYATRLEDEVVRYTHVVHATVPGDYVWPPARAAARYDQRAHGNTGVERLVIE